MEEELTGIAVLGRGSLLWDKKPDFDDQIKAWCFDGPVLKLEFSRISAKSRSSALTLVIDGQHGAPCTVAYAISKRRFLEDAISDLRCREGTVHRRIGYLINGGAKGEPDVPDTIRTWLQNRGFDAVVWTGLGPNFMEKTGIDFTVEQALTYLSGLSTEGKSEAANYIWRAPDFIQTPLRQAVQVEPWFKG
jgi:hypothetical protein